jgi:hypothetical protein
MSKWAKKSHCAIHEKFVQVQNSYIDIARTADCYKLAAGSEILTKKSRHGVGAHALGFVARRFDASWLRLKHLHQPSQGRHSHLRLHLAAIFAYHQYVQRGAVFVVEHAALH